MPLEKDILLGKDRLSDETTKVVVEQPKLCEEPTEVYKQCAHTFPESLCPYCKDEEITKLKEEIIRLKEGNFSPEELQNLCHNSTPISTTDNVCAFVQGCRDYQIKLFGAKKVRKALHQLWQSWTKKYACKACGALPDPEGLIDHHRGCQKEGMIDRVEDIEP